MRGVYCLLIVLRNDCDIVAGALGPRHFRSGAYIYVGSAMGGVAQRIGRHMSKEKKLRWHIDYLLQFSEMVATVAVHSESKKRECEIVDALLSPGQVSSPVRGFGSSDCRCASHLLYFGDRDTTEVMEYVVMRLSTLRLVCPEALA